MNTCLTCPKKSQLPKTNRIKSLQNEQNMHQRSEAPEATDKADSPQIGALLNALLNAPEVLELSASFQKMRTEEQELKEIKQALLKTQEDLQSKLVKEIDKKKTAIDKLKSEIPAIQNRCKQLGQVLGVDIYK